MHATLKPKSKKYSAELKRYAVELVEEHGYSCVDAARSLNISPSAVSKWRNKTAAQLNEDHTIIEQLQAATQRVKELERENTRLNHENSLLNKGLTVCRKAIDAIRQRNLKIKALRQADVDSMAYQPTKRTLQ